MFGARQEEGKWYLCLRKGALFTDLKNAPGGPIKIIFTSQAKAKACADELNEKWWPAYNKYHKDWIKHSADPDWNHTVPLPSYTPELNDGMSEVILKWVTK